jgi:hypothetical protein
MRAVAAVNRALQAHILFNTELLQEEKCRAEHFRATFSGFQCCIPKAIVGWERRMRSTLTEREGLSALEH